MKWSYFLGSGKELQLIYEGFFNLTYSYIYIYITIAWLFVPAHIGICQYIVNRNNILGLDKLVIYLRFLDEKLSKSKCK